MTYDANKYAQYSVDSLWEIVKSKYIVSLIGRAEIISVLELNPSVLKQNHAIRDHVIKAELVNVLTADDDEYTKKTFHKVQSRKDENKLIQGDADENQEVQQNQNFILKLISPHLGKYHVKLAFQFLRAMVETETKYWDEYINRSLRISREKEADRGNSILHEAARIGCCKELFEKYLRNNKKVVNMRNAIGETPFHLAAEYGHVDDVKMLLEFGAEIVKATDGSSPLHSATMSTEPNASLVQLLVARIPEDLRNAKIYDTGCTALHCAAGNRKITADVIEQLKSLEPLKRNNKRETVFHVAARSSNHKTLLAVLSTFSPTKYGWDIDDVDAYVEIENSHDSGDEEQTVEVETQVSDSQKTTSVGSSAEVSDRERNFLINICARNGNVEGVVALIENGADLDKGVIHVIIEESVRHPEKINSLKDVYHKITENAVLCLFVNYNSKHPQKESGDYGNAFQRAMKVLMSKKLVSGPARQTGRNPIEYAIEIGASEMLQEILRTDGAFKVHGEGKVENGKAIELQKYDVYDVTDFIAETSSETKEDRPKQPYLNAILDRYDLWRDTEILSQQPFAKLSEPFIVAVQRLCLVLGIIQMSYMIWFSAHHIDNNNAVDDADIFSFLVWPILVLVSNLLRFIYICMKLIGRSCRNDTQTLNKSDLVATRILTSFIEICTLFAFPISVFVWYATRYGNGEIYLMSMSMVLLFGWMATFLIFAGYSKETYVFSILLRELLVKDIFLRFGILFVFVVVAFSTSIHILRQLPSSSNDTLVAVSLDTTVFQVFILSMGLGEEILNDSTSKLVPGSILYKLVFAVYMLLSAIVLFNILIALMSQRFDKALRRAESEWRFQVLMMAMDINRFIFTILRHPRCQSKFLHNIIPIHPVTLCGCNVYCYRGDKTLYMENNNDLSDYGRYFAFVEKI